MREIQIPLVLALVGLAAAQPPVITRADAVRALVDDARTRGGFPGATVAWIDADGESGTVAVGDLTTTSRLMSGSIGKTYVAALALLLVADGKLALDDLAATHLDSDAWVKRVPNGSTVTIRHLLRHQSGIAEHVWMPEFHAALRRNPTRVWAPDDLLAFVFDRPPLFPAGAGWAYADTNYVLLGAVLERCGGGSYYAQLQARILTPLGLHDTVPTDHADIEGLACGHTAGLLGLPAGPTVRDGSYFINPQFEWCGGGLASTALDLARWIHALHAGEVLAPEQRAQLRDGVPAKTGRGHRYGLGTMLVPTRHGPAVGHSGVMPGYLSMALRYDEPRVTAAIMFDTDDMRTLAGGPQVHLDAIAGVIATRD